jgi:hypothetical protein
LIQRARSDRQTIVAGRCGARYARGT